MKSEPTATVMEPVEIEKRLWKVKLNHPRPFFKIGMAKKHDQASTLYLEINGSRKFEIGNDCDTCHFWFKCLQEPRLFYQKKVVNLPKTLSLPRPLDARMIQEMSPLLEMMDKGDHYIFTTSVNLTGPYRSDDEDSYFFTSEFMEIWDIEDPASEDLLSDWEHYEGKTPKVFRHKEVLEKQYEFIIPLVPTSKLKQEYIRVYQQMITNGDRPRILLLGMLQRAIPELVSSGQLKTLHSFFAGFVLDGHHKLAAYRRAGVPANCLVVVNQKASKYFPLREEGANARDRLEERLRSMAA